MAFVFFSMKLHFYCNFIKCIAKNWLNQAVTMQSAMSKNYIHTDVVVTKKLSSDCDRIFIWQASVCCNNIVSLFGMKNESIINLNNVSKRHKTKRRNCSTKSLHTHTQTQKEYLIKMQHIVTVGKNQAKSINFHFISCEIGCVLYLSFLFRFFFSFFMYVCVWRQR